MNLKKVMFVFESHSVFCHELYTHTHVSLLEWRRCAQFVIGVMFYDRFRLALSPMFNVLFNVNNLEKYIIVNSHYNKLETYLTVTKI